MVTIITLGSAAGDPMFYKKVGLLPAILVFITIILMYRLINLFVSKSKPLEHLIEGRHVCLVKEQRFAVENFKPAELSKDEILSDLRMNGVSHLGQVDSAYIEASGKMSVFFLPDDKVTFGLPVLPEFYEKQITEIATTGIYSCSYCGYTKELTPSNSPTCDICNKNKWVLASNNRRIK